MMRFWSVVLALALAGCPEDGGGDPADAARDGRVGDIGGGGEGGMAGMGGDGGADVGAGGDIPADVGPDAELDQGPPRDMFAGTDVDSCEQACGRYESCGRVDELFGDAASCLDRCARITRGGRRPDNWWSCLEVEECNLIQLCRVPELEPLTCAEVCARSTECGVDLPDCEAACAEAGAAFQQCGEVQVSACDANAFVQCLGRDVYTACNNTCAEGVRCNILRADGCLLDCVAALADADPLFSLRATQRNQCVSLANDDCAAINECINPPGPGEEPIANPQRFCALWDGCGFADFFPCRDLIDQFGINVACAIDQFDNGCPGDPFSILEFCQGGQGPDPRFNLCNRLCEAQGICGVLGADPLARPNCVQNCTGGANADPDEVERASAALECVGEDRCPDLLTCLDQIGPARECEAHCARLAECGLGGPTCEAECDAVWARDRHSAYRDCVAEAAACPAVQACALAPTAPCADFCERAVGCGFEQANGCEARCDDAHFQAPNEQLLFDACVISAPECFTDNQNDPSAQACRFRPQDGQACLGFCRYQTECTGAGDLGACLTQCGRGFVGDDGLRFLVGRECLRDQPADAACAALDACVPEELNVDCAAFCGQATACGVELADCENACAQDPLARLRTLQRGDCLAAAAGDCEAVRLCLDPPVLPPEVPEGPGPVDEATFCNAWARCGLDDFFGVRCEDIIFDFSDVERACMYQFIGPACPADPQIIVECLNGEPQEPVNPITGECAALCEARAFCNDPQAADQVACRRACEALYSPVDPDSVARLTPRLGCSQAWSCPDLAICLPASAPAAICAEHCGRLAECGEVANEAVCVAECDAGFARLRQFDYRECVARAVDCGGVQACELFPRIPCDDACQVTADCGNPDPQCENRCDDQHFREPLDTSLQVACLVGANDCAAAQACFQDPGPGARACLSYCRAITECDPNAELGLVDCLNGCVGGFGDVNGLRFAEARDCLSGVLPEAACRVLEACLPEQLAINCPAYCGELAACQVPDPTCAAACANGEISLDQGGCVADARRAGGGCTAVAECVGYVPPAAGAECVRACTLQEACDRNVDPFLCRLGCTPAPAALPIQLACAEFAACEVQADCFELPEAVNPACVAACAGVGPCGLFADEAACAAACTGQLASGRTPADWPARIGACLGEAIDGNRCDAIAAAGCFEPASCEAKDEIILVPPRGGRFDIDTTVAADNYEAQCGGQGPEVVLAINLNAPAAVTVEVLEADYDPLIFAREAVCDDPAAELACNDDFNGLNSLIEFRAAAGTYYIFIDGFGGGFGISTVQVTVQ